MLLELQFLFFDEPRSFPQHQAVIVPFTPNHVVDPVVIDVANQDGAACVQVPIRMPLPRLVEDVPFRAFVPPRADDNVLPAVIVDVAESHPVPVAALTDRVPSKFVHNRVDRDILLRQLDGFLPQLVEQLPDDQRVLLVPTVADPLRRAVAVNVVQEARLVLGESGVDEQMLRPELAELERLGARILVPVDGRRQERPGDDVDPTVAVHVPREVPVGGDVAVPVVELPHGPGRPVRIAKPVPPGDDVQFAVPVDVGDVAPFVGVDVEQFHVERNGVLGDGVSGGQGEQDAQTNAAGHSVILWETA